MKSLALLLTFVAALFTTQFALAHDDEPRLEVGAERLNPGGALEIRGVAFLPEAAVALSLIGPAAKIDIGNNIADVEGGFSYLLELLVDLQPGSYPVQALAGEHDLFSPEFSISSPPLTASDDCEQRSDEDSLLSPMPALTTPVVGAAPAVQETPRPTDAQAEPTRAAGAAAAAPAPTQGVPKSVGVIVLGGLLIIGIGYAARAYLMKARANG